MTHTTPDKIIIADADYFSEQVAVDLRVDGDLKDDDLTVLELVGGDRIGLQFDQVAAGHGKVTISTEHITVEADGNTVLEDPDAVNLKGGTNVTLDKNSASGTAEIEISASGSATAIAVNGTELVSNVSKLRLTSQRGVDLSGDNPSGDIADVNFDGSRLKKAEFEEEPDGTRETFTVPEVFVTDTLQVYRNGQDLNKGLDYTVSGQQVEFINLPGTGIPARAELRCYYEPA